MHDAASGRQAVGCINGDILMTILRGIISLSALLMASTALAENTSAALPTGGEITSGQGSINTAPNLLTITQNSHVLDTNWSSFNIGSGATVSVLQPSVSSTLIGRIIGGSRSNIDGTLNANGRVVLVNPNGIYFGSQSRVNVGGLVASSLNLNSYDEGAATLLFDDGIGSVVRHEGVIQSDYVALIGNKVEQSGTIHASSGDVALLAGDTVEISIGGSGLISAKIDTKTGAGAVQSTGTIKADNGNVLIKADAASELLSQAIHGEQSQELVFKDGRLVLMNVDGYVKAKNIKLDAGDTGAAVVSGSLDASAGDHGVGGNIDVLGGAVHVKETAQLNASGSAGGGTINVGGSWQNSDPLIRQSLITRVDAGAQLRADALENGNGGEIVVWSDVSNPGSVTLVQGHLSASALGAVGDGGRIETSGYHLFATGASGAASSLNGRSGVWLFDPLDIRISGVTSWSPTRLKVEDFIANTVTYSQDNGHGRVPHDSFFVPTIGSGEIESLLESGTHVIITTNGTWNLDDNTTSGNISSDRAISVDLSNLTADRAELTLIAHNNIGLGAPIIATGKPLDVNLYFGNVVTHNGFLLNRGVLSLAQVATATQTVTSINGHGDTIDIDSVIASAPSPTKSVMYSQADLSKTYGTASFTGSAGMSNVTNGGLRYALDSTDPVRVSASGLSSTELADLDHHFLSTNYGLSNSLISSVNPLYPIDSHINVGTYDISPQVGTIRLSDIGGGYAFPDVLIQLQTGKATITKKELTNPLDNRADKAYDGTTSADVRVQSPNGSCTVQFSNYVCSHGLMPDDHGDVFISIANSAYPSKDVQYDGGGNIIAQDLILGAITLSGSKAGNYEYNPSTVSATISPKALSFAHQKTYDGTDDVNSADVTVSGFALSETLQVSGTYKLNSANVAEASYLDLSNITLSDDVNSGGLAENYQLVSNSTYAPASVTKRTVGVDVEKVYDGNRTIEASEITITTGVVGEELSLSGLVHKPEINSANVTLADTLTTYADLALANGVGGDVGNYQLPALADVSVSVLPYTLTPSASAVTKTYDGTTDKPTGQSLIVSDGGLTSDANMSVEIAYTAASFAQSDVTNSTDFTFTGGTVNSVSTSTTDVSVISDTPLISDFTVASSLVAPGSITPYIIDGNDMSFSVTGNPTVAQFDESNATITVGTGDTITFVPATGTTLSAHQSGTSFYLDNNSLVGATISANGAQTSNYAFITDTSYSAMDEYTVSGTVQFLKLVPRPNGSTYSQEYDGTSVVGSGFTQKLNSFNYSDQEWNTYWVIKNETTGELYTPVQTHGQSDLNLGYAGVLLTDGSGVADIYSQLTFDAVFDDSDAGNRVITISNVAQNFSGIIGDNFDANYTFVGSEIPAEITPRVLDVELDYSGFDIKKYYDGTSNIADVAGFTLSDSSQILSGDTVSLSASQTLTAYDGVGAEIINANDRSEQVVLPASTSFAIEGADAGNYVAKIDQYDRYHQLRVLPKILSLEANKAQANGSDFSLDQVTVLGAVSGENLTLSGVSLTAAEVQQSAMVNFGSGPEIPDPQNTTQVDYMVNNWGATQEQAINYLTSQRSKYDNAADQPALAYPFLAATVSGNDLTEASSPGDYSLVAKRLDTGDLSVERTSPDSSANASNYCLTDCARIDGSFDRYTSVRNNDIDGILMDGLWTATITAPPTINLALNGFSLLDKIYDGMTSGALSLVSNWGALAGNFVGSDQSNLALDYSGATLLFAQTDVGSAVDVTVSNLGLSGANASAYSVPDFVTTTDIVARPITLSAANVEKIYGNNDPSLSVTAAAATSSSGLANGDALSEVTGTLSRETGESAGTYDVRLGSGSKAGNYAISFAADNNAFSIAKRPITLSASSASKIYGNADPTLGVTIALGSLANNVVSDDLIDVTGVLSRQTGDNVGEYDIILGQGSAAVNYDIIFEANNDAFSITPRGLTASGVVSDKTYDGTTDATVALTLANLAGNDTLNANVGAAFGSSNAGTQTATVSSVSLSNGASGALASNYTLAIGDITLSNAGQATISPKRLTATASVADKVYDKTDTANVTLSLNGLIGAEDLSPTVSARFASANAGSQNATIDSFTLSDGSTGLTGNYSLNIGDIDFSENTATIAQKNLTVSGSATASDKVYDGTNSVIADLSGLTFAGLLAGDSLGVASAAFVDGNAGTNKPISVSFSGAEGANYVVPTVTGLTATIAPKELTGSATVSDRIYDGTSAADVSVTLSGFVVGEEVDASVLASFDGANVGVRTSSITSVSLLDTALGSANNYSISTDRISFVSNTATITKRPLTAIGTVSNKTYDGTNSAQVSLALSGLVAGETLGTSVGAEFDSAEVGVRTASITSYTLRNASGLASNYALAENDISFANATASIMSAGSAYRLGRENVSQGVPEAKPLLVSIERDDNTAIPAPKRPLPPTNFTFPLRDALSVDLETLMLASDEPLLISVSETSTITTLQKVAPIELQEEDEAEVPLEDVLPGMSVTDDLNVAIALPNGTTPSWVGVNRVSKSISIKPPLGIEGVQTLRLGVADLEGNMAAISLRLVVASRNEQRVAALDLESNAPSTVIGLPTNRVQNLPGFLSVQALRPTRFAAGARFVFEVPNGTFVHENSGEPLRYVATLADGSPLPSWMTFDPETQTFSGQAPEGAATQLDVIVKAIDSASQEAQVQLRIEVS